MWLFPLGVWLPRSAAAAKPGADPMPASRPDPEVVAKPKRRTYTAEYKQRILQEAEVTATTRGPWPLAPFSAARVCTRLC